ncbi:MAG: NTPase [Candidatus Bathyarchaeia archaeon]
MKKLFLTGKPGVGKTTVLLEIVENLRNDGYRLGGMISEEFRNKSLRVGFQVTNLQTGEKGWLAHVSQPSGPRLGKYRVNVQDLIRVGVKAIEDAIANPSIEAIVIDEVGPMELFCEEFKKLVKEAILSEKLVIGTIHYRASDQLINEIKANPSVRIVEVTFENRNFIGKILTKELLDRLRLKGF